jgi:hypothetical protein
MSSHERPKKRLRTQEVTVRLPNRQDFTLKFNATWETARESELLKDTIEAAARFTWDTLYTTLEKHKRLIDVEIITKLASEKYPVISRHITQDIHLCFYVQNTTLTRITTRLELDPLLSTDNEHSKAVKLEKDEKTVISLDSDSEDDHVGGLGDQHVGPGDQHVASVIDLSDEKDAPIKEVGDQNIAPPTQRPASLPSRISGDSIQTRLRTRDISSYYIGQGSNHAHSSKHNHKGPCFSEKYHCDVTPEERRQFEETGVISDRLHKEMDKMLKQHAIDFPNPHVHMDVTSAAGKEAMCFYEHYVQGDWFEKQRAIHKHALMVSWMNGDCCVTLGVGQLCKLKLKSTPQVRMTCKTCNQEHNITSNRITNLARHENPSFQVFVDTMYPDKDDVTSHICGTFFCSVVTHRIVEKNEVNTSRCRCHNLSKFSHLLS